VGWVADFGSDSVTPVNVATGRAGRAVSVGGGPDSVAVSNDGRKVYVADGNSQSLTVINARTGRVSARTGSVTRRPG
jgi:YVTN family beta-propeller protein